ncbi:hypothetical protein [Halalkalicoccus subterraneus]|uniref:hypothetical protein n=1 Tax=Halalkalicoccus subterraneus TaxID=2675002 RepID=UPI000EFB71C6|nr:hypothetical protein [Halalkalicoccus subterraneus]
MNNTEVDADSIEDHSSTMRITFDFKETHCQDTLDQIDRWKASEEISTVLNFQNPRSAQLRYQSLRLIGIGRKKPDE